MSTTVNFISIQSCAIPAMCRLPLTCELKIVDKKVAKRTVVQEKACNPVAYGINHSQKLLAIPLNKRILLDQLTIKDDKVLLIEILKERR